MLQTTVLLQSCSTVLLQYYTRIQRNQATVLPQYFTTVQRYQTTVSVPQYYLGLVTCLGPDTEVVAVVTWLASEAMGVAREAVTVPRLDTPAETETD